MLFAISSFAQNKKVPAEKIKNLDGEWVNAADVIQNDGKPIIIDFWATWCKPCIKELMTINDDYEDWVEETGVKLFAISIDDSRNSSKVAPFVNGKAWEYEVYIDENQDLKRGLNVNTVPHVFVLNGKGEVVWQHNGYAPGDEEELLEIVQKVANGESLK